MREMLFAITLLILTCQSFNVIDIYSGDQCNSLEQKEACESVVIGTIKECVDSCATVDCIVKFYSLRVFLNASTYVSKVIFNLK